MEFEDLLREVGSYGPFQRNLVFLFAAPISALAPFFSMALIFVVTSPDHWCKVPDVVSSNLTVFQQRNLVEFYEDPQCSMNDLNYSEFSLFIDNMNVPNQTKGIDCRYGWEYDKSNYEATAATKWDMVCSHSHYANLVLTLQNIGGLIGTPIYGSMADRWGRKITFFVAIFITTITEVLSILTSNFAFFAILKTVSGAVMPTMIILPYIFVSEMVGPEKRVLNNGVINTCWMLGMCILPLVVYLCGNWIILGVINTFAGILILLYWNFIPESPSWLISMERYDEAFSIMMRIGIKNKKIPDEISLLKKLKTLGERIKKTKAEDKQSFCKYISKYPRLRRTFFIITFCWVAVLAAYNGLHYNVMVLEGNVFLNFFLLSVVEAPGNIIFWICMERLGRRWTSVLGFIVTGLVCILPITGFSHCETISSILGKLIISGVFMVTDQQACELYPTVCRSFGIGISKTICKAFTILLPYLIYLAKYDKSIPFIVISLFCFTAGGLATFLPESLNENLPQNISDAEKFGMEQKFFSFNRKKRSSVGSVSLSDKEINPEGQPAVFVIQTTEAAS